MWRIPPIVVVHLVVAEHIVCAVSLGIASRQQAASRRRAGGPGYIEVCQPNPVRRQLVQIGRLDLLAAVAAKIVVTLIVGDNQDNVWGTLAGDSFANACTSRHGQRRKSETRHFEVFTSIHVGISPVTGICDFQIMVRLPDAEFKAFLQGDGAARHRPCSSHIRLTREGQ